MGLPGGSPLDTTTMTGKIVTDMRKRKVSSRRCQATRTTTTSCKRIPLSDFAVVQSCKRAFTGVRYRSYDHDTAQGTFRDKRDDLLERVRVRDTMRKFFLMRLHEMVLRATVEKGGRVGMTFICVSPMHV